MQMKRSRVTTYLIFGLAMVLLLTGSVQKGTGGQVQGPEEKPELLRLHVLANSDSPADQQLKNEVKETIVVYLQQKLAGIETLAEAKEEITGELSNLERIAATEIKVRNRNYPVIAEIGTYNFPTRMYGDVIYPAGEYEAVRIIIGEGKGENWWCVLFPVLCFIEGTGVAAGTGPSYKQSGDQQGARDLAIKNEEQNKDGKSIGREPEQMEVKVKWRILELAATWSNNFSRN